MAGACALCGDAQGIGLSKSGGRVISRRPKAASLLSAGKVLRHFTVMHLGGIRGSRCSLKQEMFRLDKRRKFISMGTVKPRSKMPRGAVQIEGIQIVLGCRPLKHSIFKLACRGF